MATGRLPSVTTVLGVVAKDGLSWAAAKETALYAVHGRDQWQVNDLDEQVDLLRRHHRGLWDHRALLGTCLHQLNEAWAYGEPVDLVDLVDRMKTESDGRAWRDKPTSDVVEQVDRMAQGLAAAWAELLPDTVSVEDIVRYPHSEAGYIGQSDWRARIKGQPGVWLIDLKTTAQLDRTKARYTDSWRLQLAAYRRCTETVIYNQPRVHRPYAKGVTETGVKPLEPVDGTAVLHVRADGYWEWIPVRAERSEWDTFMALRRAYSWLRENSQQQTGLAGVT